MQLVREKLKEDKTGKDRILVNYDTENSFDYCRKLN